MKKIVVIFLFVCSNSAISEVIWTQGKVVDILLRTDADFFAVFYLDGVTEAGSCNTHRDHVIITIPKDDLTEPRYSMLLALHFSGGEAHVMLDDQKLLNDNCVIQDLRLNRNF